MDGIDNPKDKPNQYEIRIKGHVSQSWTNWLDDANVTLTDDGETIVTCTVIDQSALHGIFKRIRDFGLELISINRIETEKLNKNTIQKGKTSMNTNTMKVALYNQYGSPDVMHIEDMAKPAPAENEILIHVKARSINYGDLFARRGAPRDEFNMPGILYLAVIMSFGAKNPKVKILGSEYSGTVEAVGSEVSKYKVGDEVYGYLGQAMGANAEYITVAETASVALKPQNMSHPQATVVPYGAVTALNLLKKANIQQGQKVLINGASGAIGAAAVQLAKLYGAEVTGVAGAPRHDFIKSLGADHVIDYKKEDFTKNGETYDLIFDVLGKTTFAGVKKSLTKDGIYQRASFKMRELFQMLMNPLRGGKKVICALAFDSADDLTHITELIESGMFTTMVDRCYPLDQMADAHRYVESGNKRGNVAVTEMS